MAKKKGQRFDYNIKSSSGGRFRILADRPLGPHEIEQQITFLLKSMDGGGPKKGQVAMYIWPRMTVEQQARSDCGSLPPDRIEILKASEIEVAKIFDGAVFVYAQWSAPSISSYRFLCEALAKHPEVPVRLVVTDIDGLDAEGFAETFRKTFGGAGETIWIKRGKVLFFDWGYNDKSAEILEARIQAMKY